VSNSKMELVEIEGIFDDVEPEIIRWIFALAMAANDISYGAKKIRDVEDYEQIYLFRLGFAHLREIAKVVGHTRKNDSIQAFILNLETEAQNTYKKIEEFLSSYDNDGFVQKILKSPRDETFHYPDIKGKSWSSLVEDVRALGKISVWFDKNDKSIMGTRYRFIDVLLSQRINKGLSKETVNQSASLAAHLFSFVDYVFEYLVKRRNVNKNKV